MQYLVICLGDESEGYVLATRRVFVSRAAAEAYASGLAASRKALVVQSVLPVKEDIRA